MFRALWQYRYFIVASTRREFEGRYRGSVLGAAWLVIQPLATIAIYTVVFSTIMRVRSATGGSGSIFDYALFICSGVLAWGYFSDVVTRCLNMFIDNAALLKKSQFPRSTLPVIALLVASINFAILAGIFAVLLGAVRGLSAATALSLIGILAIQTLLAVAVGIVLGIFNIFFRDVGHITPTILQLWFWITPIIYPASILPPWLKSYISLNPLTPLMGAYHGLLFTTESIDWRAIAAVAVLGGILILAAAWLFRATAGDIVDEI